VTINGNQALPTQAPQAPQAPQSSSSSSNSSNSLSSSQAALHTVETGSSPTEEEIRAASAAMEAMINGTSNV